MPSTHVFAENNISGQQYVTDFSLYVDGEKVEDNQTIDYYASIKLEYELEFPNELVINDGDTLSLPIPKALIQKNSLQFPIEGPGGVEIGKAVAKDGEIKITFNDYFKNHPENKYINVELWSEWDKNVVENDDWVDIEIANFKIHVQSGTGIIGEPEDHEKWGSFNEDNTDIEWTIKLNGKFDAWENVTLKDFIGSDQELIEDSIGGLILESFDDYTNHEEITPDMIKVNSDKSGFQINLGDKLNKCGLLLMYRVKVKNLEEGKIYTNGYELSINGKTKKGEAKKQYLSGGGSGGGTNHAEAKLQAKKT